MSNPITNKNPRGAGRKKTGEKRQFSVTGLSPELAAWIDSHSCKSDLIKSLLQAAYDKD